eukprot:scaffold494_cov245-Pinguiococcus_pyrenoidosus.AAC.2
MAATPDSTEPQHPGDSCQTSSLCLGCAVSLVEWMTGNGSGVLRRDAFGSGWRRRGALRDETRCFRGSTSGICRDSAAAAQFHFPKLRLGSEQVQVESDEPRGPVRRRCRGALDQLRALLQIPRRAARVQHAQQVKPPSGSTEPIAVQLRDPQDRSGTYIETALQFPVSSFQLPAFALSFRFRPYLAVKPRGASLVHRGPLSSCLHDSLRRGVEG